MFYYYVYIGHFDEKAMPSAGLGSFARSFVCTFNNTCHMEAPLDISQRSTYNDTLYDTYILYIYQ